MKYYSKYSSPVGIITLICDDESLTNLSIEGQYLPSLEHIVLDDNQEIIIKTKKWLSKYFQNEDPGLIDVPLKLEGTVFQRQVWNLLLDIPYGKFTTYKDIATKVASIRKKEKMSSQAVGQAVGKNPISIIIPCHRVVGSNQNLVGYGGGIDKKIKLLECEGINLKNNFKL